MASSAGTGRRPWGASDDGPRVGLRAVGSLYPEPVHVLVRADSALHAIGDLKGRRVAIGLTGSASRDALAAIPLRLLPLSERAVESMAGARGLLRPRPKKRSPRSRAPATRR